MKNKLLMMTLVFAGCAAYAQHDHAGHSSAKGTKNNVTFKDKKLGTAYEHYLHIKNALVASDPMETRAGANKLKDALTDAQAPATVVELASKIAGASGVEDQRKIFSMLTGEMKTLVSGGKLSAGAIYWEYCPMAFSNTGAYWLSSEREIKNPYFGNRMLKCGSVKETIQ